MELGVRPALDVVFRESGMSDAEAFQQVGLGPVKCTRFERRPAWRPNLR